MLVCLFASDDCGVHKALLCGNTILSHQEAIYVEGDGVVCWTCSGACAGAEVASSKGASPASMLRIWV